MHLRPTRSHRLAGPHQRLVTVVFVSGLHCLNIRSTVVRPPCSRPAHLPPLITFSEGPTPPRCTQRPFRYSSTPVTPASQARGNSLRVGQTNICRFAHSFGSLGTVPSTTPGTCQCSDCTCFLPVPCPSPHPWCPTTYNQWVNALLPFPICSLERTCETHSNQRAFD